MSEPQAAPIRGYYRIKEIPLTWSPVTWATEYVIEVDNSSTFTPPLDYQKTVGADVLSVTTPELSSGLHFWRVGAKQGHNPPQNWSAVQIFQIVP